MVPNETKETEQKKSFCDKFLENVLFNSIFPVIDWIDKLHDFDEKYASLAMVTMGTEKSIRKNNLSKL